MMKRKSFVVITVAVLTMIGATAYAGHQFRDVPNTHTFHSDISWAFENGLTFGCNPASGGDLMCPDESVTRGQMMAFFNRYDRNMKGDLIQDIIIELPDDLQGPAGAQGPKGEKGDQGNPGVDGVDGVDGQDGIDGQDGEPGLANLQADGPYPGETHLTVGGAENSHDLWDGDEGATLQTSWVKCPDGQLAVGGGFGRADAGGYNDLNIVTSAPTEIRDHAPVLDGTHEGAGVGDWSMTNANGWLVEGFNNGTQDQIVRPYVVCATVGN